ncbi:carbohydrate esterase family 3 protein [Oidiodendron maius Zn]|uniref:Carbohydrate esterase family 3 protein n=1 Tax=Oidiodendron maius (strain Zn) TaxID=913774 RepID=A0A0C3HY47_OIDMZ|nr:carbohydrate esterase family 3 protein [Oidiodendron maius Zn]
MYIQSSILLCGIASPWLATAAFQSPRVAVTDPRSLPINNNNIPLVSINKNLPLRILPIGDSLTWGYLSSGGNGYRLDLLNLLSQNPVEYIGSQMSGNMTDNHNEGHPGAVITKVEGYVDNSVNEPPNLVLLMAGSIDIVNAVDPSSAPDRLGHLIDEIVQEYPRAAVLVAELPPIEDADSDARAITFNAAVPGIVKSRTDAGRHIVTVNMSAYVTVADLQDGLHPTDYGYSRMAQAWYDGIKDAESRGWLVPPVSKRRRSRKRAISTTCSTTSTTSAVNKLTTPSTTSSSESTTTLTSTRTLTSTVTIKAETPTSTTTTSTTTTSISSTTSTTTPSTTTTTSTTSTTTTTTTTSTTTSSTPIPTFIPTYSVSFPNGTTSSAPTTTAPASVSLPSSAPIPTSSSSGLSTPPPTGGASRPAGNLSWMAVGLLLFWLSGMAM